MNKKRAKGQGPTKRMVAQTLRRAADAIVYLGPEEFDDEAHKRRFDQSVLRLYRLANQVEQKGVV